MLMNKWIFQLKVFMKPRFLIPLRHRAVLKSDQAPETPSKVLSAVCFEAYFMKEMLLSEMLQLGEYNVITVLYFRAGKSTHWCSWLQVSMPEQADGLAPERCFQGIFLHGSTKPGILINIHIYFVAKSS